MSEIENHPHSFFWWLELCTHNCKEGKIFIHHYLIEGVSNKLLQRYQVIGWLLL